MKSCKTKRRTSQIGFAFGYDCDRSISVRKMRNKRKVHGKSRPKTKCSAKVQGVK